MSRRAGIYYVFRELLRLRTGDMRESSRSAPMDRIASIWRSSRADMRGLLIAAALLFTVAPAPALAQMGEEALPPVFVETLLELPDDAPAVAAVDRMLTALVAGGGRA